MRDASHQLADGSKAVCAPQIVLELLPRFRHAVNATADLTEFAVTFRKASAEIYAQCRQSGLDLANSPLKCDTRGKCARDADQSRQDEPREQHFTAVRGWIALAGQAFHRPTDHTVGTRLRLDHHDIVLPPQYALSRARSATLRNRPEDIVEFRCGHIRLLFSRIVCRI